MGANNKSAKELIDLIDQVLEQHDTGELQRQIEKRTRLLAASNMYWLVQEMPVQEMLADVAITAYIIGNLDGRRIDLDDSIKLDPAIWGIINDFEGDND